MSARPSYAQLQKTVAELSREKKIAERLAQVAAQQVSELRSQLAASQAPPPAPVFVPIKRAKARGYSNETIRRWCHADLVNHRWDGSRLLVDQDDLTARCNRLIGQNSRQFFAKSKARVFLWNVVERGPTGQAIGMVS